MNINHERFNSKKFERCKLNLGNVYMWAGPLLSRTDAQNGVDITFNRLYSLLPKWPRFHVKYLYSVTLMFCPLNKGLKITLLWSLREQ